MPLLRRFGAFVRDAVVVGAAARVSGTNSATKPRIGGRGAGANDLPHKTSQPHSDRLLAIKHARDRDSLYHYGKQAVQGGTSQRV